MMGHLLTSAHFPGFEHISEVDGCGQLFHMLNI